MPISTISPQNNSQQAALLQSLSGTGASLMSALNSAIQKSRDDAQIRFNQEQNLINEQQRNIENERIERFNVQDRTEFALNFDQTAQNNELDRKKKRLDLGELEKVNEFNEGQRDKLTRFGATDADFKVRQAAEEQKAIDEGVTSTDKAIADKENLDKLTEAGQDPTSRRIKDGEFTDTQRGILEKEGFTPAEIKVFQEKRARTKQEKVDTNQSTIDEQAAVLAGPDVYSDINKVPSDTLSADLDILQKSTNRDTPDSIRRIEEIRNVLSARKAKADSKGEQDPSKIAGLEAELSQLKSIEEPTASVLSRIAKVTGEIEELQRKNSSATNPSISTSAAKAALQASGITD